MTRTGEIDREVYWQLVDDEVTQQGEVDHAPIPSAAKVQQRTRIRADIDDRLDVDSESRPDHPPS